MSIQYPHVWLYCKNHYVQSDDRVEDLRKVVAHFAGIDIKYVRKADILHILGGCAMEAVKHSGSTEDVFRQLQGTLSASQLACQMSKPRVPEPSNFEFLCSTYMTLIANTKMNGLVLPEPDSKILPTTAQARLVDRLSKRYCGDGCTGGCGASH